MRVSIVLPAIDETDTLKASVTIALSKLSVHEVTFVIVTSAKFTTEECRATINELTREYGSQIDHFDQTLSGVGGAIQEAFLRATGDAVVLMTSDRETPPEVVGDMVAKIEEGYDMATATRWRKSVTFNGYPPVKLILNFVYQQVFRVIYFTSLSDLTYGYRAFKREKVQAIRFESLRHPIFFETLLKPLRLGYRIAEVDAPWSLFTTRKADVRRGGKTDGLMSYIKNIGIPYTKLAFRVRFMDRSKILRDSSLPPNPESVKSVVPTEGKNDTARVD